MDWPAGDRVLPPALLVKMKLLYHTTLFVVNPKKFENGLRVRDTPAGSGELPTSSRGSFHFAFRSAAVLKAWQLEHKL